VQNSLAALPPEGVRPLHDAPIPADFIPNLRREVMRSAMKTTFTFTRDEVAALLATPPAVAGGGVDADAQLGRIARAFMEKAGPIKTVGGKDVYSFLLTTERGAGLDAAITAAMDAAALSRPDGEGAA
jgi:hypothetical protein